MKKKILEAVNLELNYLSSELDQGLKTLYLNADFDHPETQPDNISYDDYNLLAQKVLTNFLKLKALLDTLPEIYKNTYTNYYFDRYLLSIEKTAEYLTELALASKLLES